MDTRFLELVMNQHGLNPSERMILLALFVKIEIHNNEIPTKQELADFCGLSTSGFTYVMRSLIDHGFVKRTLRRDEANRPLINKYELCHEKLMEAVV